MPDERIPMSLSDKIISVVILVILWSSTLFVGIYLSWRTGIVLGLFSLIMTIADIEFWHRGVPKDTDSNPDQYFNY